MKIISKMVLITLLAIGCNIDLSAQGSTTGNIGVTARLAAQLRTKTYRDVDFGGIFITSSTQNVSLEPTTIDEFNFIDDGGEYFAIEKRQTGLIRVDANSGVNVNVNYPESLTLNNGIHKITYKPMFYNQDMKPLAWDNTVQIRLDDKQQANGYFFPIGGDLEIPGLITTGTYSGKFVVTVTWQ